MITRRLFSTNVKDIGTLYLVYAILIKWRLLSMVSGCFIPWDVTRAASEAKLVVHSLINEASNYDPKLYAYVQENCLHMLNIGEGVSDIPTNILSADKCFTENSEMKLCTNNYTFAMASGLLGKAGCYAFFNTETRELLYVGSCINYASRLSMHYSYYDDQVSKFYKGVLALGGFSKLSVIPVMTVPNRVYEYTTLHKNADLYSIALLRMLTQYEIRMNEQALISYYSPSLNGTHSVIFSLNMSRLYATTKEGSVPVTMTNELGDNYSFLSIKQANAYTGINESTITRSANCLPDPSWCYSQELEMKVHFTIPSYPNKTVRATSTDFSLLEYDYDTLPVGRVFFLDENKELLPGEYKGFKLALEAIGNSRSKPGKYANKDFLINSPVLGKRVYMVYNPKTDPTNGFRLRPLKSVDTLNQEPDRFFNSGKELMDFYGMTRPFNTYITRGMKVNKRYRIYYADDQGK